MRTNIHPNYNEVTVSCTCGNTFTTRSTKNNEKIQLDICGACHPFYTGTQKLVDTARQIEKFNLKYKKHKNN